MKVLKLATPPKLTISIMAIIFVIPLTLAYIVYMNIGNPKHTLNHGTLVRPTTPIPSNIVFTHVNGKISTVKQLKHSWWLLYITNKNCDKSCKRTMYNIRQVHRSLGKNYHRLNRMYVYTTENPAVDLKSIKGNFPEQTRVATHQKPITLFLNQTLQENTTPFEKIYLIDPLGNLVMYYNTNDVGKGLLHDLQKLLKISRVG